jgi:F420-dependent oxidoreductase-like protein
MRLGLHITNFTWDSQQRRLGDTFRRIVECAERAGLYSFWVMDHLFQIPSEGPADHEMLESWSALAFAAGCTNRIRLGTLVTGITYRHPGILVKMATTLDVLSRGRVYFGLGAGWNEEEHQGLGISFPPTGERFERLEETLQIALQMWAGEDRTYEGKHYHLLGTLNSPQSVQRPHPPILIGGGGEHKTLRLVAQYADACNLSARRAELPHKLDVLRGHCQFLGRPYDQIEKTAVTRIHLTHDGRDGTLTPAAAIRYFAGLGAMGIDHAIFSMPNVTGQEVFDLLATEVIPEVEKLPVAGR